MSEATVVTSENAAQFYAEKLNLAPASTPAVAAEEKQAEPVVENKSSEVEATTTQEQATEAEKQETKRKDHLQDRFDKITKQREEARAEAQREREAREAAERRARELEAKLNPPKPEQDEPPTPDQFNDIQEYTEALSDWKAEQKIKQKEKEAQERAAQAEREKLVKSWQERQAAVKAELPDYDAMIASSDVVVSDAIRDAILESDVGPKILYHLAENPDIAESLNAKSTVSALRELGKLEAKLAGEKASKPAKAASEISKAPEPIKPLKGNAGSDVLLDSKGVFHGTYAQWKEARMKGKIK